jgi:hypothetical protein
MVHGNVVLTLANIRFDEAIGDQQANLHRCFWCANRVRYMVRAACPAASADSSDM